MRLRAGLFLGLLHLLPYLGGHCSLASVSAPLRLSLLGGQGAGSGRRTALNLLIVSEDPGLLQGASLGALRLPLLP